MVLIFKARQKLDHISLFSGALINKVFTLKLRNVNNGWKLSRTMVVCSKFKIIKQQYTRQCIERLKAFYLKIQNISMYHTLFIKNERNQIPLIQLLVIHCRCCFSSNNQKYCGEHSIENSLAYFNILSTIKELILATFCYPHFRVVLHLSIHFFLIYY